MNIDNIVSVVNAEIAKLKHIRDLLAGLETPNADGRSPKGKGPTRAQGKTHRTMSPETRARMAAAQQKRWAEKKKKG